MHDPLNAQSAFQTELLLTERQLATRWCISIRTLQNRRVTGNGVAYVKIGASVRYRLSDIVEFENAAIRLNTSEERHA